MRASSGTSWLMIVPNRYSRLLPRLDSTERCSSSCIASRSGDCPVPVVWMRIPWPAAPPASAPGAGRARTGGLRQVERTRGDGADALHLLFHRLAAGQLPRDPPAGARQQPAEASRRDDGVAGGGDQLARLHLVDAHQRPAARSLRNGSGRTGLRRIRALDRSAVWRRSGAAWSALQTRQPAPRPRQPRRPLDRVPSRIGGAFRAAAPSRCENEAMQLPVMPPVPPMLAKSVPTIPPGASLRAEVGRVPVDHLPRRRRGRDRQPQRAADDPLLPRAGRGGQGRAARAVRDRRRDRRSPPTTGLDFEALQQRIHPADVARADAAPSRRRRRFIAFDLLALGDDDYTGRPFAERRAALDEALAGVRAADPPHPGDRPIATWRSAGSPSSRAPGSTA